MVSLDYFSRLSITYLTYKVNECSIKSDKIRNLLKNAFFLPSKMSKKSYTPTKIKNIKNPLTNGVNCATMNATKIKRR